MNRRKRMLAAGGLLSLTGALLVVAPSPAFANGHTSVTAPFPSAGSTVVASIGFIDDTEIGYFWSHRRGDSVTQTIAGGPKQLRRVVLDVDVVENTLAAGTAEVDWDVVINGKVVDAFAVPAGFTGPMHRVIPVFRFEKVKGPTYTVSLRVADEVAPGDGSISLAYAGAAPHSITLSRK